MAASEYVVSVVELPLSAETVQRMARAVESVDWDALGLDAYNAWCEGLAEQGQTDIDCQEAWQAAAKAIYAEAAKHIIAAALETGARE